MSAKIETITEKLTAHIIAECSQIDMTKRYDEMLDECYDFKSVGGSFAYLSPSRVLAEMCPTDYRCGFADFTDGERDSVCEIGSDYYDRREVDKEKESFIDDLNAELAALEKEFEELTEASDAEDDETPEDERIAPGILDAAEKAIADKEAEIAEAEACEF